MPMLAWLVVADAASSSARVRSSRPCPKASSWMLYCKRLPACSQNRKQSSSILALDSLAPLAAGARAQRGLAASNCRSFNKERPITHRERPEQSNNAAVLDGSFCALRRWAMTTCSSAKHLNHSSPDQARIEVLLRLSRSNNRAATWYPAWGKTRQGTARTCRRKVQ